MSKIASLSISKISDNRYQWTISGLSSPFNTTNYIQAGLTEHTFTNGSETITGIAHSTSAPSSGTSTSVTGTFDIYFEGVYRYYGYTQARNGKYYSAGSAEFTHTNPNVRPSDFSWAYPKESGADFIVTEGEWTAFQSRINQFRKYKGLSSYGFTSVSSGQDFQAYLFRQAANAIYEISSSLGVASACRNVQSGDAIYGWYFTNLSTALNNVT